MMSQIAVPPLPKLPLGEAISLSYAWFFQKFADVLRISWLWLVLGGVLIGAANWMQWSGMAAAFADAAKSQTHLGQPRVTLPPGHGWLMLIAYLVVMLGTVSIAVAWHRRILLDEQPGLSGSNIASTALWHYIGTGIVLGLIFILLMLLIFVPIALIFGASAQSSTGDRPSGSVIAYIVLIAFALYITALSIVLRLSVLLPARAVGDSTLTFRQAWNRTRGNTWRMFWGLIACSLPPVIVLEIISLIVAAAVGFPRLAPTAGQVAVPALGLTIISTLMFVLSLLIVPIYIGFLSQSYRHFSPTAPDVSTVFE
jgi:hypothetical protein